MFNFWPFNYLIGLVRQDIAKLSKKVDDMEEEIAESLARIEQALKIKGIVADHEPTK